MNNRTILISEDEDVIRRLCVRLLNGPGRRLVVAENVQTAFAAIDANDLDLLITDLRLPDGNGVEIVQRFKGKFPNQNAIIITGSPTPEERLDKIKGLFLECIFKPFDPAVLGAAVRRALGEDA